MKPSIRTPKWLTAATHAEISFGEDFQLLSQHTVQFDEVLKRLPLNENPNPKPKVLIKLELGKPLGNGYLWDVYQAKIHNPSNLSEKPFQAAVKVTTTYTFDGRDTYDDYTGDSLTRETAVEAIKNEHEMYTKHLSDLQGIDIPRYYGTFKSENESGWIMILEDCGMRIGNLAAMWNISEVDKERVEAIFKAIHDRNVLHYGVEIYNVLKRQSDGEIRVIDFHRSFICKEIIDLAWEQHDVKINLGKAKTICYEEFCRDFELRGK